MGPSTSLRVINRAYYTVKKWRRAHRCGALKGNIGIVGLIIGFGRRLGFAWMNESLISPCPVVYPFSALFLKTEIGGPRRRDGQATDVTGRLLRTWRRKSSKQTLCCTTYLRRLLGT